MTKERIYRDMGFREIDPVLTFPDDEFVLETFMNEQGYERRLDFPCAMMDLWKLKPDQDSDQDKPLYLVLLESIFDGTFIWVDNDLDFLHFMNSYCSWMVEINNGSAILDKLDDIFDKLTGEA